MTETIDFIKINGVDLFALLWFFLCFKGYTMYAAKATKREHGLSSVMHQYRVDWMKNLLLREVRVADTTTIANLERGVTFFASTTMLILAGLVTVLGSTEKAIDIISDIPFASHSTPAEWEMKLLLLVALFIYAFFKFTWSLRQYGFASVMIGGTPMPDVVLHEKARIAIALRTANIMSLAANNFNAGLRTYYFSFAALAWFISTAAFFVLSLVMVFILYRREFKSNTLHELVVSRSEEE
ncbi:MAG: DUF599 domain-containing protein [Pseudomonadota bacterium]